ncbi:bifunctional diaminohydroxyphosphoribosylaminopyrimidine deaminase/5-amino-6-(5-phosphoribosylamino)uracil reductase RibD [Heliobacterium gestii]|uniref:Riboflavin biosynthesis protein RibD n=2 Tax=Heliomicrobium gestii TaxID=2699 RepID=A0A845LBM5_HELGE|nr:bifunctional diaminohydroxyphosphoribosylaminopyrimidine deaminase/5-amino-6-(5-phosphoribosylamino)uracil reductase RibD [Heliomicrobium gestii]
MIEDQAFMGRALELAALALGRTSPNPVVGSVITQGGRIVGEGYHQKAGTPHAEVHALRQAGEAARGGTLYVTLEPCNHHGRTPPCTEAIIAAGVTRVVAAVPDPNPQVAGTGFARLREAGIEVEVGVMADAATAINQSFFTWVTRKRPWVLLKWAMTADGKIAAASGDSRWVSGAAARGKVHEWRQRLDAILVGIGTVLADDPQLTVRLSERADSNDGPVEAAGKASLRRNPLRVIVDSAARTPVTAKVLSPEAKTIIAVTEAAPGERVSALEQAGASVLSCPADVAGRVDLTYLLNRLACDGVTSLLVEGGACVHGAFLDANLADQVAVFLAPKIVGGEGAPSPVGGTGAALMAGARPLQKCAMTPVGDDWLLEGVLQEVRPCLPES